MESREADAQKELDALLIIVDYLGKGDDAALAEFYLNNVKFRRFKFCSREQIQSYISRLKENIDILHEIRLTEERTRLIQEKLHATQQLIKLKELSLKGTAIKILFSA